MQQFEFQNVAILQMVSDMKYFIIPLEKNLEMKQHIIIIFSVNQLTRIKTNLCLSYKTNMENIQDSFSKYFILCRG